MHLSTQYIRLFRRPGPSDGCPQDSEEMLRMPPNDANRPSAQPSSHRGFTLVELLVVITIVVALAALSVLALNRTRFAAAKATTVSQLRQISIAVNVWAQENNNGEPFYVGNTSADMSHECKAGDNPKLAPGNPAKALYSIDSPADGYLTDHTLFFSPLVNAKAPDRKDYHPEAADPTNLWGTYAWYYPSTTTPTARQKAAIAGYNALSISRAADKKLLMATDYINRNPKWEQVYLALMLDGSVNQVAETQAGWIKWKNEE